jgi:hypothetical protein
MIRLIITALLIAGLLVAPVAADDPEPTPEPEPPPPYGAWAIGFCTNTFVMITPVLSSICPLLAATAWAERETIVEAVNEIVTNEGVTGNFVLDVINKIAEIVIGGLQSIINFIGGIFDAVGAIMQIVKLALDAIFGFIGKVWGWIGQAIDLFFQVLRSIIESPPQQIPGLPRCVSAPTQYEICAIWYIFDWTVFADNTPGALLIPLMVLIIDIGITYYVIRSVFRIVKQFQSQLGDG